MAPLLTEEESAIDPYAILGLDVDATAKDVQKAYRKKSLLYHPDKNPAPEAIATFRQVSLAVGILKDQNKKSYLDTRLEDDRKKKARYAEMDKKRKKMVDDLVEREEQAKKARVEQQHRRRQEAEEESIKDAGKRMLEEAQKKAMAAAAATVAPSPAPTPSTEKAASNGESGPDITPECLTLIFILPSTSTVSQPQLLKSLTTSYGAVNHLILPDPLPSTPAILVEGTKKKKTKSRKAVVEFAKGNWGGCYSCCRDVEDGKVGKLGVEGVKVKWAVGEAPSWVAWAETQLPSRRKPSDATAASFSFPLPSPSSAATPPSFTSAPVFSPSTSMADLLASHAKERSSKDDVRRRREEAESMTLSRMRMMEREKLEAEIKRQEEED
ncbi:hypothetical protein L198_06984 [Cryptococcus wingfieldii CBS 7118]|uniref:J domain-containing protein n=1 Tax=Cryptococcus wingfieldii CBS 7118 TaxID=1295528 RepID=A0A1E3IGN8_9TREE|nr:hypothetical protein L198_06984 [Cryptococcus wingfieldii CBS 7118]ODN87753.1 hypothetical protein L198_06984 [Cryptococcus wingfieldii CBS 7118]